MTVIFFLASCGGGGSDAPPAASTPENNEGVFIDSPVIGIEYETATLSGKTDKMGTFFYADGESVTFKIGDIVLPEVVADNAIHVSEIFGSDINDQQVINLARLLLTLDTDQNPDNGLDISTTAISQSLGVTIDFASSSFETDVVNYVANAGGSGTLVSESITSNHILDTLEEANNLTTFLEDAALFKCTVGENLTDDGTWCVQRANYNDFVVSFSPRHQQIDVSINTNISLTIEAGVNTGDGQIFVELFPLKQNAELCRIDWGGFRCGSDEIYDTDASFANIENGTEFLSGAISTNPIIFGNGSIDQNNQVVITPERNLAIGTTYVVHIFGNSGFSNFKTWWIFKT